MSEDACGTCGGDRRIGNAFGLTATCPSCHGSGRRSESTGFHDVTKTKASHHAPTNRAAVVVKVVWPVTADGGRLATEVKSSSRCTDAVKMKLIQDIIDHESARGVCTKTFMKKIRQQVTTRVS
jgi:hypothetical protein